MIVLPFPVSVNQLYGQRGGRQKYIGKKYREWLKIVPPIKPKQFQKVALRYTYYMPDKRSRDLANYEKCVTDYLVKQGFLIDDDYNCLYKLTLVFGGIDKDNSRVEIGIDGD